MDAGEKQLVQNAGLKDWVDVLIVGSEASGTCGASGASKRISATKHALAEVLTVRFAGVR